MKEMTSAEFRATDLVAVGEPVLVKRYTKAIGTYYPSTFKPSEVDLSAPGPSKLHQERISELEEEVRRLKQLLAAREVPEGVSVAHPRVPTGSDELVSTSRRTLKRQEVPPDAITALPTQDREFFERKMGKRR